MLALLATSTTLCAALAVPAAASADSAPISASTPTTVTADALPTVQVDGVVWTQAVSRGVVFAGGAFQKAYPAGVSVKAGAGGTPRSDLLAYDLATGELQPGFAPRLNGQVRAIATSADGSTVYVGGEFTQVNGRAESRVVALDAATGEVRTAFTARASTTVNALALSGSTLYIGGSFTSVNGTARSRVAAVDAATGKVKSWRPTISDGRVAALAVSPDAKKLVLGGSFSKVDGTQQRGLAMVDTTTGAKALPFAVNAVVQDYGVNASILSLTGTSTGVYGTGYTYGSPGNFEGTFRASWTDGRITWLEDCHGDTYSVAVAGDVAYTASHAHYCGDVPGGFPQSRRDGNLSIHQRALAFSSAAAGTLSKNPFGSYADFSGRPAPKLLAWYPDLQAGAITGMSQAAWSVTAAGAYVLYGGEFPRVNGKRQAGLVRFALPSVATNAQGPQVRADWAPTAVSTTDAGVRVGWETAWDSDNETLTYRVYRDGDTSPVYTTSTASDGWWNRPYLGFVDSGLPVGSTPSYVVTVTDPFGNHVTSAPVSTVVGAAGPSAYAKAVLAAGASHFWRFGEPEGNGPTYDWAGWVPGTAGTGVRTGTVGAVPGDRNGAATFSGDPTGMVVLDGYTPGPNTYSAQAWFKTTSKKGGSILGFSNLTTGDSEWFDRGVYMDTTGQVHFGVWNGGKRIIGSPKAYNDGRWHEVVSSLGSTGMRLYIDGALVASNTAITSGQKLSGYWHVGGSPAWNGTEYFAGSIDEVALYPTALPAASIATQYKVGKTGVAAAAAK